MKTNLPEKIEFVAQAKRFLTELSDNEELYNPDDSAFDIVWSGEQPSMDEMAKLDELMSQLFDFGNFDPHEFILKHLWESL